MPQISGEFLLFRCMIQNLKFWKSYPESSQTGDIPPSRQNHCGDSFENTLILFGGAGEIKNAANFRGLNDIYMYDVETNNWRFLQTTGTIPSPRICSTGKIWGSKFVLFGGFEGTSRLNDVHILDLETKVWSCPSVANSHLIEPRSHHDAFVIGSKYFVFGGLSGVLNNRLNDVQLLELETMKWSTIETKGEKPPPRLSANICVWQNKLVVFGGYTGGKRLNDIYVLDLGTKTWSDPLTSGQEPSPRYGSSMNVVGSHLILIGGNTGVLPKYNENDVHILNLYTMEWKQLTYLTSPVPRSHHITALLPDRSIITYGGSSGHWNSDVHILDTSMVKELQNWPFEEAKTIIKSEIRSLSKMKKASDISSKVNDITLHIQKQYERIRDENEDFMKKVQDLAEKKRRFDEEKQTMKKYEVDFSTDSVIKLNVGGTKFQTTRTTLTNMPDTMLASMFSGRYKLSKEDDGCVFIDRDGTHFRYILNYLRNGCLVVPDDLYLYKELLQEVEYYQILPLYNQLVGLIDSKLKTPQPPNSVNVRHRKDSY
eukprot:TRINITY_DN7648_c0_g1_i1.p1 TRINITY_DN7648_c0_g1~~TRINITY_DN7648_c0_g1_i1.p1  ORF type:complete len:541 (-),score=75.33 TRINITY_DN7648_c0_g1_i1:69-1691(-)